MTQIRIDGNARDIERNIYTDTDRNIERNIDRNTLPKKSGTIPQVDGPVDTNTSSSSTTDSIDLTVSPQKKGIPNTSRHNTNKDSMNNTIDEICDENKSQTRASKKSKGIRKFSARAQLNKVNATQAKVHTNKVQKSQNIKAQTKDDQTTPNITKSRIYKTYEINQEKKELLKQR